MDRTGTKISDVSYDATTRHYQGAVTFYGPHGTHFVRVRTPGNPAWGYARALDALVAAGERSRAAQAAEPS